MEKPIKQYKQRTNHQNNSLHLYCTQVSDLLKEHGVTLDVFFQNIEVEPEMESVKKLFQIIAKAKFNKSHTSDLDTTEMTQCYDEVNKHIAQWGLHVDWPSYETLSLMAIKE
jgi:hypothetical protein